jgi:putative ABC transport system permease protein
LLFDTLNLEPDFGVTFLEEDVRQRASVAVIGSEVKEELFGQSDALGRRIKIKNHTFRIVGVIEPAGQVSFFNVDETVFVPYTTAQAYLSGTNYYNAIWVKATSQDIVDELATEIERTLRDLHRITDPEKDDFHVTTQADAVEMVGVITTVLQVLLVSIAAISLLVGGIGIMNIMLVSVTERTREIGLRKALGARETDILRQFLYEAVLLTLFGGCVGIMLGAALSFLASLILSRAVALSWQFTFPVSAMLLGLGVSTAIGLVFGLYPARAAARKNPMESLRYE